MPEPIYQCWTKGTDAEPGPPQYAANWVVARRGHLKVYSDRLECGDWNIPSSAVHNAVLFETRQWFIPVYVLSIQTDDKTYQFGLNPWVRISSHLPFEFRRERVKLGYSVFSIAIRIILIGFLVYQVWLWLATH